MDTSKRYTPAERERAVRLLFGQQGQYSSQWAAIQSIASKVGLYRRGPTPVGPTD